MKDKTNNAAASGAVPFGQRDGVQGDEMDIVWDADKTGSMLVEGRIGSGIGTLTRTLVRHALSNPEGWEAVVVSQTTRYSDGVRSALRADAQGVAEACSVLGELAFLSIVRANALQDLGVRTIAALDALGPERPKRILVVVEQPHHYPEGVVRRIGELVLHGRTAGVHVAAMESSPQLLPDAMRSNFGARAKLPEMMTGKVSYAELGGEPVLGHVRHTGPRELEEIVATRRRRSARVG